MLYQYQTDDNSSTVSCVPKNCIAQIMMKIGENFAYSGWKYKTQGIIVGVEHATSHPVLQ
jgi:hypothetical protein